MDFLNLYLRNAANVCLIQVFSLEYDGCNNLKFPCSLHLLIIKVGIAKAQVTLYELGLFISCLSTGRG